MQLTRDGVILSDAEVTAVIDGALRILERTGVRVENAAMLRRLEEHGAATDRGAMVCRFPSGRMADFLAVSERADWQDTPVQYGGHAEIYQGWYLDPDDGRYKPWTEKALLDYARLARALPNVGGVGLLGMPLEGYVRAPQALAEKVFCWKWGLDGGRAIWETALCPKLYQLWNVWANHTGKDIQRLFNGAVYLISPLKFASVEAEQYMWFAERGLEVSVGSLGSLGGTAPVTPAGALALQTAEGFFVNFLRRAFFGHQDLRLGNSLSVLDVRTGCFQYGRPEQTLLNIAGAAIARTLGAHYGGHGGLSDAKEPGAEAAMQKVSSAIYSAHSSGHGHIVCGLLAVDEVFSPEQLVLDNEAVGWLRRMSAGVEVNEDTLAPSAVDEAGQGGEYLSLEHTAENFRKSLWFPQVFSTESFALWSNRRGKGERETVRDRMRDVMASAPPLEPRITPELESKLWNVIDA